MIKSVQNKIITHRGVYEAFIYKIKKKSYLLFFIVIHLLIITYNKIVNFYNINLKITLVIIYD